MISSIGYILSAVGFTLLSLLILSTPSSGLPKRLLQVAVLANLLFSGFVAFCALNDQLSSLIFTFENLRNFAWILFLLSCVQQNSLASFWRSLLKPGSMAILAVPLAALVMSLSPVTFVADKVGWLYLTHTLINLEILILLETFYRQSADQRWSYKPLIVALGSVAIFDFVLYSQASMVNLIDPMLWTARGYVYAISIPFLIVAIRRIQQWGIDIFISREIVTSSSLVIVAGGYLLLMSVAGYAIKFIGGEWSSVLQIVFFFLALTLLAALLLSNDFRTRIKVFVTKHFFANQYDYRVEWLNLTRELEEGARADKDTYQVALRAMASSVGVIRGQLIKYQNNELIQVASMDDNNATTQDFALLGTLLPTIHDKHWIIDLYQLRTRPFDYEGIKVSMAQLNACSFDLILPIFQQDNLWGVALLNDKDNKRPSLNWELRDYLTVVSAQVGSYLFQYEASRQLAENAQFAAFSRMSAFVVHDLKNVLAQIDLILSNADQHRDNPEFIDDTFETLQHTKSRMDKMLRQLTEKQEETASSISQFSVCDTIDEVINRRCQLLHPLPVVDYQYQTELTMDADRFANVMYHLISNAQQATPDDGQVTVVTRQGSLPKTLCIDIVDTGCGMTEEFIHNRLFKPFDSTKGNAGMGIGAYDAKHFVEKAGGKLDVISEVGEGTTFTLTFPI